MSTIETKYQLPVLLIESFAPTLSYDGKIYASELIGKFNNIPLVLYETKGLDYSELIGIEVECVIEITRGIIYSPNEDISSSCTSFDFIWEHTPTLFFPELLKMVEGEDSVGFKSKRKEEDFEKAAEKALKDWGLDGFGLEYTRRKPMLKSENGIFLINEFEFENEIDFWDLGTKVFIEIHEAYLRGIRPYIPPEDIEEEVELTEAQKAEKARRAAQQERSRLAHEQMQERIRKRREAGEGPGFSVV